MNDHPALSRADSFCRDYSLRVPILLAPMAGACPPLLSAAVANAGGLGACGALLMQPGAIEVWVADFRARSNAGFQLNLWIPDPPPSRSESTEAAMRSFLAQWGPEVPPGAADATPPDFSEQSNAVLNTRPNVISSIMGLYPAAFVERMHSQGTRWFATATTVTEAKLAEAAGADVIVAQGMEAGGHRGAFEAQSAEVELVGLFSLLPAIVDAVRVPVVATGGIGDSRGIAAALLLGASAVQIGTGFLRCPESNIPSAWADAIGHTLPEQTRLTRAFSGRVGRTIATKYVQAASASSAPKPAPYPVQRALTQRMRDTAIREGDLERMQAWAGQSARLAPAKPASVLVRELWESAQALLR